VNQPAIEASCKRCRCRFRWWWWVDRSSVAELLDLGVQRVILGTVAVEQPQLVAELCQEFPEIVVGIDARNGRVATRGWLETSEVLANWLCRCKS